MKLPLASLCCNFSGFFCCNYWKIITYEKYSARSSLSTDASGGAPSLRCSGQQQDQSGQQAQGHWSPAEGRHGLGAVAQVRITADIGEVKVEAGSVFLAAHATLGGDGTALLIHAHLERSCKRFGEGKAGMALMKPNNA